jgi:pyrroline-5-carboxylate reductase
MNKQIGFIGCGKMAQAMIEGLLESELVQPSQIIASARSDKTLNEASARFQINVAKKASTVVEFSEVLFLAVKPDLYKEVINEIKDALNENTIIITIAAGITLDFLEQSFGKKVKAIRTMPNTPSLVGEGMTAICPNEYVTEEELAEVITIIESFSKTEVIDETLMDAIPAISGSSPAYVYMLIEAMADGGVLQGIPREKAYKFAAQAVLGAAKMVLETGTHPGQLKDHVCTPGGATIEAISMLEKNNFRATVLSAMESCTKKSTSLAKN